MADLEDRLAGLAPALNADTTGADFADVLRRRHRNRVTRTATVAAVVLAMVGGSALAATSLTDADRSDTPRVTNTGTPQPSATPTGESTPTFAPDPKMAPAQAAARAALEAELQREAALASKPLQIQDILFTTPSEGIALGQRCDGSLGCMNEIQRTTDGGAHWGQRQALTPRIVAQFPWDFVAPDRERWMVSHLAQGNDGVLYAYGPGLFGAENLDAPFTGGVSHPLVALAPSRPGFGDAALDASCEKAYCSLEYDIVNPLSEGGGVTDTVATPVKGVSTVMHAVLAGEYGLFALADANGFAALASVAGSDGTQFTTTKVPCPGAESVSMSSEAKLSIWMLCTAADGSERLFHTTDGQHFSELPRPGDASVTETLLATTDALWRWSSSSVQVSTDGGRTWTASQLPGWDPVREKLRAFHVTGARATAIAGGDGRYTIYASTANQNWAATEVTGLS